MVDMTDGIIIPLIAKVKEALRVALPGVASGYERARRRVGIEWKTGTIANTGQRVNETKVEEVPVYCYRSDGYAVAMDFADGDPLFAVIADRAHLGFWESGATTYPTIPDTHNLAYAMAFPGGTRTSDGSINAEGTMLVGAEAGNATTVYTRAREVGGSGSVRTAATGPAGEAVIEAPSIKLGDNATKGVVLNQDPVAPDNNFVTMITAIAGVVNGIAPGTITPPQLVAFQAQMGNVTSTAMKASAE